MHTCSSGRLAWCVALVLPRARSSRRRANCAGRGDFIPKWSCALSSMPYGFGAIVEIRKLDRTFTLQVRYRQPRLTQLHLER